MQLQPEPLEMLREYLRDSDFVSEQESNFDDLIVVSVKIDLVPETIARLPVSNLDRIDFTF